MKEKQLISCTYDIACFDQPRFSRKYITDTVMGFVAALPFVYQYFKALLCVELYVCSQ